MAKKIIDITEKLSFDENPVLVISGQQITINADADTVLRVMGAVQSKGEIEGALSAYELLISEEDRMKLAMMKIPMKDLMAIIEMAMNLAVGEDAKDNGEAPGETQTHTTI